MLDQDLCRAARARRLALNLQADPPETRPETMRALCIENGGDFTPPDCHGNWGPGRCEIKMLDIFGSGDTEDAAIVNWIDAAKRAAPKPPKEDQAA